MYKFFNCKVKKMPTEERRNEITSIVEDIIKNSQELCFPAFDIVKFLKERENFVIASQLMTDDTTGMLFVDDENFVSNTNSNKLILINSVLQDQKVFIQRRRFIIAHEYGHYILHKKSTKQYAHRDTHSKDDTIEREADYFARCLLMPKEAVDILLKLPIFKNASFNDKVSLIARVFNVTKKKANQRLKEDLCYNE